MNAARALVAGTLALLAACAPGDPRPVDLQPGTPCAYCRMTIVDSKLASQIVAPGEDPRLFDDLGCLQAYLAQEGVGGRPGIDLSRVFVADHTTGEWIRWREAVLTRDPAIATPMNSHLVAHRAAAAGGAR